MKMEKAIMLVIASMLINCFPINANHEFMDIMNVNGTKYQNVSVLRATKEQYRYVSVNESTGDVYRFRDRAKLYAHHFYLAEPSKTGVWVDFQNRVSKELGWATRYPDQRGRNCTIMSSVKERNRLVKSFADRNLAEDNLIMISIMTYVNELNLDIRIGNDEYEEKSFTKYRPLPFAFLKGDFERDYKYLPIRLHQFRPLAELRIEHHIMEYFYEITEPRKETINLNISGDCWRSISVFTDKYKKTHIGPISVWVKNAIVAHLIKVLHDITSKLKDDQGLMWRDHFMKDVCYVERREKGRYSVPFHLKECCTYTQRMIGDALDTLPLECRTPDITFQRIRLGIIATVFIVFGFTPLLMFFAPSKPRPYKKLRRETKTLERESSEQGTQRQHCSDDNGKKSTPTFVVDLEKEKTEAKEVSDDEPALPSLVKEGVHFNFDVPDRIYLDSYPEFHLNLHMVLSYLCLCHVENHALIIVRRMLWTFVSWMTIGLGLFYYSYYFPVLLKEPVTTFIVQYIILPFVPNAFEGRSNLMALIFYLLILPLIITIALFVLLAPILWKKQSISLTLLQKGDLRFFGNPFPEQIVKMSRLQRRPKVGIKTPAEVLLTRNMLARLRNLIKRKFWQLWWQKIVCSKNCLLLPIWLPISVVMIVVHSVPIFSVWSNFIRQSLLIIKKKWKKFSTSQAPTRMKILFEVGLQIMLFLTTFPGAIIIYMQVWLWMVIYLQFFVFLAIDILRNASTTLPVAIIILSMVVYLKMAFRDFEDEYRRLKEVVFDLCKSYSEEVLEDHEKESEIVLIGPPHEPLYIKTTDGEVSIPRRVFYDVCRAYLPYRDRVMATFSRLALTFFIINVVFIFIIEFQVMGEFTRVGETFLTICTVSLPTLFGTLKSDSHRNLSKRRRVERILGWLSQITTVRRVDMRRMSSPKPKKRSSSSTTLIVPPLTITKE